MKRTKQNLNSLAAELGVTHTGVRLAVLAGTLTAGVRVDGKRVTVTDSAAAVAQWRAMHEAAATLPADVPPIGVSRARYEAARAELAERELAQHKGRFLETEIISADVRDKFATVRVRLLAVPSNLAQRITGAVTPDVLRRVVSSADDLIRAALEELADERAPGQRNHEPQS
jgi:hypothetical protein